MSTCLYMSVCMCVHMYIHPCKNQRSILDIISQVLFTWWCFLFILFYMYVCVPECMYAPCACRTLRSEESREPQCGC